MLTLGRDPRGVHEMASHMEDLIRTLGDPSQRDDLKLNTLQEISENLESLIASPAYSLILENLVKAFLNLLRDTNPQFIGENNTQQLRKLVLEMFYRMPCSEQLKPYSKVILPLMFKLVQIENEENAIICLRIIIEFEKQYKPPFTTEVGELDLIAF
ncbi:unnamed protein product [Soboliphyme baturini]|uniref:TGRM2 n=1 Tax=Soboliphyme baturini TaxID=241478 RepID=A0A183I8X9_9BILA|nr:unnamed protein product [Soboliphyme baturini]